VTQRIQDTVVIEGVSDTDPVLKIIAYAKGGAGDLIRLQDESGSTLGGIDNLGVRYGSLAGGGTDPSTLPKALYQPSNISCANGAFTALGIDNIVAGTGALLDVTVPTSPKIKTAGLYAISCTILPGANLTAGTNYYVTAVWDNLAGNPSTTVYAANAGSVLNRPAIAMAFTWYFTGTNIPMLFNLWNADSAAKNFRIDSIAIQKLA